MKSALLRRLISLLILFALAQPPASGANNFGQDVAFLQKHTDALVLRRAEAAIVLVPQYQGRVMTATARGDAGPSSGWINYAVVENGLETKQKDPASLEAHMLAFGGEERFWMGPEGGQYSIFFAPGTAFDFAHWFTPAPIDSEPWGVVRKGADSVVFAKKFSLLNHSGTRFAVEVERTVELLDNAAIKKMLGAPLPAGVSAVAYRTTNRVTNAGEAAWRPETGLLSVWMLCMFVPSPTTTVFIPFAKEATGSVVNADYFGRVPPDRLKVEGGVIYFKCDGTQRGKIGVPPRRSRGIAASYDPVAERVTLLQFEQPRQYPGYVNSKWELQKHPLDGDAINSYNDGPVDASGKQMGPFYEIESSSPALDLAPGQSAAHTQTILHLYGNEDALQKAVERLGLPPLKTVASMFAR